MYNNITIFDYKRMKLRIKNRTLQETSTFENPIYRNVAIYSKYLVQLFVNYLEKILIESQRAREG